MPEPFETTIGAALETELTALGLQVAGPPENLRERTPAALVDELPVGHAAPHVLLAGEIEDFFFETRPGVSGVKMETFFTLTVTALDAASREILWEGTVEAGTLDKKGMFLGKEGGENRLDAAFQDVIERVLRHNEELRAALAARG